MATQKGAIYFDHTHSTASVKSNPPSNDYYAGKTQTEHVLGEFFYKTAEIILQSRVNIQLQNDSVRSSRRARFSLDIQELSLVREAMIAWKENIFLPLIIDIYLDGHEDKQVLMERWHVGFISARENESRGGNDVLKELKEFCKKAAVLLRALYSLLRQLPAHRFFLCSYPSCLRYRLYGEEKRDRNFCEGFEIAEDVKEFKFLPIQTPFGKIQVIGRYCLDSIENIVVQESFAAPKKLIFQSDVIIQNYVSDAALHTDVRDGADQEENALDEMLEKDLARRRSTPGKIMTAEMHDVEWEASTMERAAPLSQPMAIPCTKASADEILQEHKSSMEAKVSSATDVYHNEDLVSHPRSFGDNEEDQGSTHSSVFAAPYGYKNLDARDSLVGSRALGMTTLASRPAQWNADVTSQDRSKSKRQSTPPIHPNSLPSNTKRLYAAQEASTGSDYRASLENFSLDASARATHTPQPTWKLDRIRFEQGDHGKPTAQPTLINQVLTQTSEKKQPPHEESRRSANSTLTTPPFSYHGTPSNESSTGSSALVLGRQTGHIDRKSNWDGASAAQNSPPFQANPCELLSVPSGLSYCRNKAVFVARTDHYRMHRRSFSFRGLEKESPSKFGVETRASTLESRIMERSKSFWGIASPSLAENHSTALIANDSTRQRNRGECTKLEDEGLSDLPFAITHEGDDYGYATSDTTAQASTVEYTSPLSASSSIANSPCTQWETTVSVSRLLHALNHAPKLGTESQFHGNESASSMTQLLSTDLDEFLHLRDSLSRQ